MWLIIRAQNAQLCDKIPIVIYLIIGSRGRTDNPAQLIPDVEFGWFPCFNTTEHYAVVVIAFIAIIASFLFISASFWSIVVLILESVVHIKVLSDTSLTP